MDENVVKELERMIAENKKSAELRERYVEIAQDVNRIARKIQELSAELMLVGRMIDPVQELQQRKNKKMSHDEEYRELYDKMVSGIQLTKKLVMATYPDLEESQVNNMMTQLQKMPGIRKQKDGKTVRLYLDGTAPSANPYAEKIVVER